MRLLASAAALLIALPASAHEGEEPHSHAGEEEAPAAAIEEVEVAPPEPSAAPPAEATQSAAADPATAPVDEPSRALEPSDGGGSSRTIPDNDWRQRMETGRKGYGSSDWFEPTHFVVEIRFGPYFPEVDEEFGGAATPYADFFGNDGLFYFGLELDWLPMIIPYVGSLGPGFGWGWTHASGKAVSLSGNPTEADTGLTIFPMHASGVLRIDGPLRKFRLPIVPHIKVGIGFAPWEASGPDGTSTSDDGASGEGLSAGLHLAVGGSIALNAFDPAAAVSMKEDTGIRYAYLWGEWMYANLDGIGSKPAMHVGTSTGVVGLGLDF